MKTRILVEMDGGLIQCISATKNCIVVIKDYDIDCDPEEILPGTGEGISKSDAYVQEMRLRPEPWIAGEVERVRAWLKIRARKERKAQKEVQA